LGDAQFKEAYARLQKQDVEIGRQNVIVLSPDIALLIGEGTSSTATTDGRTFSSRWAETVVYVRVDNEWKVLHDHQSLPRRG
jgi:ketosteroid isomerase-like protein